jgi:hypothetical protein
VAGLASAGWLGPIVRRRHATRRWIASVRARPGRARLDRSVPPGGVVVRRPTGWAVAERRPSFVAAEVTREGVALAADVLDGCGIRCWWVPTSPAGPHRLAVHVRDRARLVDAVAAHPWSAAVVVAPASSANGEIPAGNLVPACRLGRSSHHRAALRRADMWKIGVLVTGPRGGSALGEREACEIEFWRDVEPRTADDPPDAITGVSAGPVGGSVAAAEIGTGRVTIGRRTLATTETFARYHDACRAETGPIDVVYTWVDHTDPEWRTRLTQHLAGAQRLDGRTAADGAAAERYTNRDELRWSLRSLAMYADFVGHVYLVTDGQVPRWLDPDAPGLTVVDHVDLFDPSDDLPVFNSHAIESRLHRIGGLTERYLYLNDDVFFARRVHPSTFFHRSGASFYFPSRVPIPPGPVRPGEPSVSSAAKNVRDLVFHATGHLPTQKMKHTPHPQQRSLLLEIEERFPEVLRRQGSSRFRCATDVSVASSLHHHYGEAVGAARAGAIAYDYVNLAAPDLAARLDRLRTSPVDTFCLNDVEPARDPRAVDAAVCDFLASCFPFPSPYERVERTARPVDDATGRTASTTAASTSDRRDETALTSVQP